MGESRRQFSFARRAFLAGAGGLLVTTASPRLASAQFKTVGFLMGLGNDAEARVRIETFERGLSEHGWLLGRDLRVNYRFSSGNSERIKTMARELVAAHPDVIVGHSTPVVRELVLATRTIPIVFVVVADPVGGGFARSIAHPGGNVTGFTNLDAPITGKLLTLLKELLPSLDYVGLMYNPDASVSAGEFYLKPFEKAAPRFGVQAAPAEVRSPEEIRAAIANLGSRKGAGLVVMPDNFLTVHRRAIIGAAAEHRLPTIYPYQYFVDEGGLLSYGVDVQDLFRRSAEYVSRILRGANPATLPIQAPSKFTLAINLKTASELKLIVPRILLAGADSVVQ